VVVLTGPPLLASAESEAERARGGRVDQNRFSMKAPADDGDPEEGTAAEGGGGGGGGGGSGGLISPGC
jgi:hypothetical protein